MLNIKDEFAGTRVHLIGIGGSGMSGAAALLLKLGAQVSGSDLVPFEGLEALQGDGARVAIGHREEHLDAEVELVVVSAAIPPSNPELAAARARDVRVIKYAELLGALMRRHPKGVAIAGTHGKSTTTAMCVHLCRQAGLRPSFLVGARSEQLGGSSGLGMGPDFIAESCEFDRSFLHLAPDSAAILNIEPDHLDCYRDLTEIVEAFARFCGNVDPDGLLVCNADDPWAEEAAASARAAVATFGFEDGADWQAVNLHTHRAYYAFDVCLHGRPVLTTRLSIPGRHNVANALAAVALAHHLGADFRTIERALPTFTGVTRRMTWRGTGRGVIIVDDYAHHPTEIRVTIEAAQQWYHPKRTWVVFQPHQHSRTRHFMDQFANSLTQADEIIVSDVYGARELDVECRMANVECRMADFNRQSTIDNRQSAMAQELVSRICRSGGRACHLPDLDGVADHLIGRLAEGDLVLTMGAGDVWKVADELVERICEPNRA